MVTSTFYNTTPYMTVNHNLKYSNKSTSNIQFENPEYPDMKTLHVYNRHGFTDDKTICDENKAPLYCLEFHTWSKPFAQLHLGESRTGDIVGIVNKKKFSNDFEYRVGNGPAQQISCDSTFSKARHVFTVDGVMGSFQWKRTHGDEVKEAGGSRISSFNLKLVDFNDKVVALFVCSSYSYSKLGKFFINKEGYEMFGDDWESAVVITGLSLLHQERKRQRAKRSAARS